MSTKEIFYHPFPSVDSWCADLERRAAAEKDFREVLEKIAAVKYAEPEQIEAAEWVLAKHPEPKRHD
jgi:hypothetical protein